MYEQCDAHIPRALCPTVTVILRKWQVIITSSCSEMINEPAFFFIYFKWKSDIKIAFQRSLWECALSPQCLQTSHSPSSSNWLLSTSPSHTAIQSIYWHIRYHLGQTTLHTSNVLSSITWSSVWPRAVCSSTQEWWLCLVRLFHLSDFKRT